MKVGEKAISRSLLLRYERNHEMANITDQQLFDAIRGLRDELIKNIDLERDRLLTSLELLEQHVDAVTHDLDRQLTDLRGRTDYLEARAL